eukprot:m51a1_g3592 putative phosphatidylserine decarboxylase (566) ;mRNA; f:1165344-1167984
MASAPPSARKLANVAILGVKVVEGTSLAPKDMSISSDPYVVVSFAGQEFKTRIKKRKLNPTWNETFNFLVHEMARAYTVRFDVWDYDTTSKDDYMGSAEVSIEGLWDAVERDLVLPLAATLEHHQQDKVSGRIHVQIRLKPKEEIEAMFWRGVAKNFDSDMSGFIDRLELAGVVASLGGSATESDLDTIFAEIDRDKDHTIKYEELHKWATTGDNANALMSSIDVMWRLCAFVFNDDDIGDILLDADRFLGVPLIASKSDEEDEIRVVDRKTGQILVEKIPPYIKIAMRLMYSNWGGRHAVSMAEVKKVLGHLTKKQGKKYDNPASAKEIPQFVRYHRLDTQECLRKVDEFKTFNEFFYRELKPGMRPVDAPKDDSVAVSPADCRMSAFASVDESKQIWVKGETFSLKTLFGDDALAAEFNDGSFVIARLSPQDYHRFHSPVSGVVGPIKEIEGTYYTVNPIAVNGKIDVYGENRRMVTTIETQQFGRVVFVAVGATMVGSIRFTARPGQSIKKGDELGYFAFGGSTDLLFFKKGRIELDSDLLENSAKPIETYVRVGFSIGKAV